MPPRRAERERAQQALALVHRRQVLRRLRLLVLPQLRLQHLLLLLELLPLLLHKRQVRCSCQLLLLLLLCCAVLGWCCGGCEAAELCCVAQAEAEARASGAQSGSKRGV